MKSFPGISDTKNLKVLLDNSTSMALGRSNSKAAKDSLILTSLTDMSND